MIEVMMILNIDIDGVLYNFRDAFINYCRESGRDMDGVDDRDWKFWPRNMPQGEYRAWFRKGVEDGYIWAQGDPYPRSAEWLWRLSDEGHHIQLITQRLVHNFRHKQVIDSTTQWLDMHNIPYRSIIFLDDTTDKGMYQGDMLLDDRPRNIIDYKLWQPDSTAVLMRREWNAYYNFPHDVEYEAVDDMGGFYSQVQVRESRYGG